MASEFTWLRHGVPQGAILSPLLFSVYMNDMLFGDATNLFADDKSSYVIDKTPSGICMKLQRRTDALCEWFDNGADVSEPHKNSCRGIQITEDASP